MQILNEVMNESPEHTIKRFVAFRKTEAVAEGTIAGYRRILQDLASFVNHISFASLTRSDLELYLADWAERESTRIKGKSFYELGNGQTKKTSSAYMNFIRTVLKYFFKWLYQTDDTYPECVIKISSIVALLF
ncbi:MAG: hypothetical protein ACE5R6_05430 [Candidatus Heimdallarchaeota archaeon]